MGGGGGDVRPPPFPKATLHLVEKAIAEAWRVIRDHPEGDFEIDIADEKRVTRELPTCLVNRILDSGTVGGFTSGVFGGTSDGRVESLDAAHLVRMPAL